MHQEIIDKTIHLRAPITLWLASRGLLNSLKMFKEARRGKSHIWLPLKEIQKWKIKRLLWKRINLLKKWKLRMRQKKLLKIKKSRPLANLLNTKIKKECISLKILRDLQDQKQLNSKVWSQWWSNNKYITPSWVSQESKASQPHQMKILAITSAMETQVQPEKYLKSPDSN